MGGDFFISCWDSLCLTSVGYQSLELVFSLQIPPYVTKCKGTFSNFPVYFSDVYSFQKCTVLKAIPCTYRMLKYWHSHPINLSNPIYPQKLNWSMTQLLFLLNTWQNHQKRWGQMVNVIYRYLALIKCPRANNLFRNPLSF